MRTCFAWLAAAALASGACAARGSDEAVAAVWEESPDRTDAPSPAVQHETKHKPRKRETTPHPEMVEVRQSLIPGAGEGLFAKVDIPDGTYIGSYAGRLVTPEESDAMQGTKEGEYLFFLPACANDEAHDSIAGDMEDYISKVNYAPATINRQPTYLQNVTFENFCEPPYVRLFAMRKIDANEELYVDYGPDYNYDFMEFPAVQEHLLRVTGISKAAEFTWEHKTDE